MRRDVKAALLDAAVDVLVRIVFRSVVTLTAKAAMRVVTLFIDG